jgi:hypothetical protein
VDPTDPHRVLVRLVEGGCEASEVTVTVNGVADDQGHTLDSASVTFGVLFGDVNGDGMVDGADADEVRAVGGRRADDSNFRADVNADGGINHLDFDEVKNYNGTALP